MQVSSLPRSESVPVLVNNDSLQHDPSHATCIVSTRSLKAEHDTTNLWIPTYRSSCILSHFAHIFEVNDWLILYEAAAPAAASQTARK